MEVLVKRIARKENYTIGRMYIDGKYVCDTLEDADRLYFGKPKIMHVTAIPCGRYELLLNNKSPRFKDLEPYKTHGGGCVPLVNNVPQFSGVRIHVGNTERDTDGCILVGKNTVVGKVLSSKVTYISLMDKYFTPARNKKERVYITIQ